MLSNEALVTEVWGEYALIFSASIEETYGRAVVPQV